LRFTYYFFVLKCKLWWRRHCTRATENARLGKGGTWSKMQGWKRRDWKTPYQNYEWKTRERRV